MTAIIEASGLIKRFGHVRALHGLEHSAAYWVALSLVCCVGIVAVSGTIAVSRFARQREQTDLIRGMGAQA